MATASRFVARALQRNSTYLNRLSLELPRRSTCIHGFRHGSTSDPDRETGILKTFQITKADAKPVLSEHHDISFDDRKVLVPWEEGKTSYFQHLWLRDHCQCSKCRHPETKQRLVNTFDLPKNIKPAIVKASGPALEIKWKDGHESSFSWDWLHLHSYSPRLEKYLSPQFHFWGSEIEEKPPEVEYGDVMESDEGVALWTAKIYKYGFCYVNGVPLTPEATKALIERIAFIRETHYGGFWEFTADLAKKDTAYTNLALGVHTDTTYFTDPAGLQLFHLLEHSGGSGGQSILVDGFRAAKMLREENPQAYKVLSNVRIPAHASGNPDSSIQPYAPFPVMNHHPVNGELVQIRWNNDDRATMDRWDDLNDVEMFYDAARAWNAILKRKGTEYWEQLKPGRALIFDNWRVLHGRSAFTGKRRMCGGYVNMDDYKSRLRTLCSDRERLLRAL
ncbi:Trimethyllysine dioxygenase [Wilcoxina mikolae CBS 423.85]|nr:Trimethyllysine dioxygenase [Wilcoxina mikolae CBS 423.85]